MLLPPGVQLGSSKQHVESAQRQRQSRQPEQPSGGGGRLYPHRGSPFWCNHSKFPGVALEGRWPRFSSCPESSGGGRGKPPPRRGGPPPTFTRWGGRQCFPA